MIKQISNPTSNPITIGLAVVIMIISVTIGIGLMVFANSTYGFAITGEELLSLSGGNDSLAFMTTESGNFSLYSNEWPNIHSNVETDFNTNISFPEIQETAFIH